MVYVAHCKGLYRDCPTKLPVYRVLLFVCIYINGVGCRNKLLELLLGLMKDSEIEHFLSKLGLKTQNQLLLSCNFPALSSPLSEDFFSAPTRMIFIQFSTLSNLTQLTAVYIKWRAIFSFRIKTRNLGVTVICQFLRFQMNRRSKQPLMGKELTCLGLN